MLLTPLCTDCWYDCTLLWGMPGALMFPGPVLRHCTSSSTSSLRPNLTDALRQERIQSRCHDDGPESKTVFGSTRCRLTLSLCCVLVLYPCMCVLVLCHCFVFLSCVFVLVSLFYVLVLCSCLVSLSKGVKMCLVVHAVISHDNCPGDKSVFGSTRCYLT